MSHLAPGASFSCYFSCSQFPLGWPLAKYLGVGRFSLTALAQTLFTNSVYSTGLFNFDSQNRSGDSSQLPSFHPSNFRLISYAVWASICCSIFGMAEAGQEDLLKLLEELDVEDAEQVDA